MDKNVEFPSAFIYPLQYTHSNRWILNLSIKAAGSDYFNHDYFYDELFTLEIVKNNWNAHHILYCKRTLNSNLYIISSFTATHDQESKTSRHLRSWNQQIIYNIAWN